MFFHFRARGRGTKCAFSFLVPPVKIRSWGETGWLGVSCVNCMWVSSIFSLFLGDKVDGTGVALTIVSSIRASAVALWNASSVLLAFSRECDISDATLSSAKSNALLLMARPYRGMVMGERQLGQTGAFRNPGPGVARPRHLSSTHR